MIGVLNSFYAAWQNLSQLEFPCFLICRQGHVRRQEDVITSLCEWSRLLAEAEFEASCGGEEVDGLTDGFLTNGESCVDVLDGAIDAFISAGL